MMSTFSKIMFAVVVSVITIVAALVAIATDAPVAVAQANYLAKPVDSALVKHRDVEVNAPMSIAFGSDDAAYFAEFGHERPADFGAFLSTTVVTTSVIPVELPGTSGQCSGPVGSADFDATAPLCK